MTYAYIVIFNGPLTARVLKKVIEASRRLSREIEDTYVCFPNTLLVATELTATDLAALLRGRFKTTIKHILVLDSATDRNGWLPKSAWEFLRRYDRQSDIEVDDSVAEEDRYPVEDDDG